MLNDKDLPNYILKQKSIHKMSRTFMTFTNSYEVLPLCRIYNTTLSYRGSTDWIKVNCKKCLKYRKKVLMAYDAP
jgi:hypothetical protein